jgi:hypothetical protein
VASALRSPLRRSPSPIVQILSGHRPSGGD